MSVLGIDLSASEKRASAWALLDGQAELSCLDQFKTFDDLLGLLEVHKPTLVAVDAPLSLPLGLDCLEESHLCTSSLNHKGRLSEQELARMNIGCFFTTKRSIIKSLIYRGVELQRELVNSGYQIIEVYPYATKVILFGDKIPPKNSARGLAFLKEKLYPLISGLDMYMDALDHNRCDALLAAYTAFLHSDNQTDSLGIPEEGYTVVPKLLNRAIHKARMSATSLE